MQPTAQPLQLNQTWHSQRLGRLTGSMFGAALGLSPFLSRQALWRQLTGRAEPFAGNVATDWGTSHEAEAINAYEVETGSIVIPAPFVRFEDWSGASPDGYVWDDGLLEVKCPFSCRQYEAWPDHYRAQVVGQLAITGRAWCDCWCWTPEGGRVVERIHHDQEQWERVLKALRDFYKFVVEDKEPPRAAKFKFKEK